MHDDGKDAVSLNGSVHVAKSRGHSAVGCLLQLLKLRIEDLHLLLGIDGQLKQSPVDAASATHQSRDRPNTAS